LTSSTGGAERETRIVSPMPSESRAPKATADLIVPWKIGLTGDAEVQRVLAALGEQAVGVDHHDRVVVLDRDLDVAEAVLLEQGALPERGLDQGFRGGLAVLGEQALVQRAVLTPMRMGMRLSPRPWRCRRPCRRTP
jgi:hypothetical protein